MITGSILTLDLGNRTGFCKGRPGEKPRSGVVILKKDSEKREIALGNLIAFLDVEFRTDPPAKLFKEQMLHLQAFIRLANGANTVASQRSMHGIVEGMCNRFSIAWEDVPVPTARKHFIGSGNMGSREATKEALVDRCHLLGLMPRECRDDNQADAIAIHDWACFTHGRKSVSINKLHLFGEKVHG